jgi:hypothetical protein
MQSFKSLDFSMPFIPLYSYGHIPELRFEFGQQSIQMVMAVDDNLME